VFKDGKGKATNRLIHENSTVISQVGTCETEGSVGGDDEEGAECGEGHRDRLQQGARLERGLIVNGSLYEHISRG
jgi:hypothetical protein